MFAHRRSSQKPHEALYAAFKESFPDVGPGTSSTVPRDPDTGVAAHSSATVDEHAIVDTPTLNRSHNVAMPADHTSQQENSKLTPDYFSREPIHVDDAVKDHDHTPKQFADQWRLTPSMMDPNSFAFSAFANQPPGYYTPTPGGFNTFYHSSAAGDLHTPGMGMNTPLSLPHSIHNVHAQDPSMHYSHFNPQLLHHHPQSFADPYHQHQPVQQTQQLFAPPSHFLHQDSGYEGLDDSSRKVTPNQIEYQNVQSGAQSGAPATDEFLPPPKLPSAEKFRFHTTLNAPTAMVRSTDEIPITYLNKGQAYTLSIFDTAPPPSRPGTISQYRTYVRVSFEDEQQRAKPGACWQLWKEGRGTNEAHQRGGKLLAVEYVDPNQGGDEEFRKSQTELEKASFDGFAVTWYPNNRTSGAPDCTISVRFNFLSTDFSHSKGVKGIPVRLCAKTELTSSNSGSSKQPEVCFSKVKLFRDHGAERKLSNDIVHVKKSIDKLKQQISQAESGMGNLGKRKRSGSMAKDTGKMSAEEDLHQKLANLQDMFSSTRPLSVLFLRGEPEDDPDTFPVSLTGGDDIRPFQRMETWTSRQSGSDSPGSNVSPTPSSICLTPKRKVSEIQSSTDEQAQDDTTQDDVASPDRPIKVQKRDHDSGSVEVLAADVDDNYRPPTIERPVKPVACFYVKSKNGESQYYRAVYLLQRSVKHLKDGIAEKFGIHPERITRVTHVNSKGLQIIVDEDVVREVPEGQDMVVEFLPTNIAAQVKNEWAVPSTNDFRIENDFSMMSNDTAASDALEMWLNW